MECFGTEEGDNRLLQSLGVYPRNYEFESDSSEGDFEDLVSIKSCATSHISSTNNQSGSTNNGPNVSGSSNESRAVERCSTSNEACSRGFYSESVLHDKVIRPNLELTSTVNFFPGFQRHFKKKNQSCLGRDTFIKGMDDDDFLEQTTLRIRKGLDIDGVYSLRCR